MNIILFVIQENNSMFSNQVRSKYASLAWTVVNTTYHYNKFCSGTASAEFPKLCGLRRGTNKNYVWHLVRTSQPRSPGMDV